MIQQRITQYIEKNHLFSSDSKILVALSGGADSVALLRILHTAGYHCNSFLLSLLNFSGTSPSVSSFSDYQIFFSEEVFRLEMTLMEHSIKLQRFYL